MRNIEIHNSMDIIDSRDVIARIIELEADRDSLKEVIQDARETLEAVDPEIGDVGEHDALEMAKDELSDWDLSDEAEELATLKALADQGEGYGDWPYGETLIRDTYFEEYAEQLAEDIGAIDRSASSWPAMFIDWEAAADALKADYSNIDFDGEDYWIRS